MKGLRVHPLHVGTITRQAMTFCYWLDPGKIVDVPIIAWYIEGSDKKILVDTGGGDPAEAHPRAHPYKRPEDQTIENALKKIGVRPEEIEIVICTHLHWDHSGDNQRFPKAKKIVQQEELVVARHPLPILIYGYPKKIFENVEYTAISGDQEIAKGVKVLPTPGHTLGMMGVLVEGDKGRIFIAGDTFGFFKNLESDPPMISGLYVDVKKYYESIERISKLSAFVLPGHDIKVFDRKVYE